MSTSMGEREITSLEEAPRSTGLGGGTEHTVNDGKLRERKVKRVGARTGAYPGPLITPSTRYLGAERRPILVRTLDSRPPYYPQV